MLVQVSPLFAEWYQICEVSSGFDNACMRFVLQLHQSGLLRGDDITDRFFRVLLVIIISVLELGFNYLIIKLQSYMNN